MKPLAPMTLALGLTLVAGGATALAAPGAGANATDPVRSAAGCDPAKQICKGPFIECPTSYSVMLDASDSIKAAGKVQTVRDATTQFLSGLQGTAARAGLGQFGTVAQQLTPTVEVTAGSMSNTGVLGKGVQAYFNPQPPLPSGMLAGTIYAYKGGPWRQEADWYTPAKTSKGWTNWDAGLGAMRKKPVPDVAVFVTDGEPTSFNLNQRGDPYYTTPRNAVLSPGMENIGINTAKDQAEDPTMSRAVQQADLLKAAGAHVVAIGIGTAFTDPENEARLRAIGGPDIVTPQTIKNVSDIDDIDGAVVSDYSDAAQFIRTYAEIPCGPVTFLRVAADDGDTIPTNSSAGTSTLVTGTSTPGEIKAVATECVLNGQELTGTTAQDTCGLKVRGGTTQAAAERKRTKLRVTAAPTCNRALRVRVRIVAKAPGQRPFTWVHTWSVAGNSEVCPTRANG